MRYKEQMRFTNNGFFMGCLLFITTVIIYEGVRGYIFETLLSTLFFFYLSLCIWSFAFLTSILAELEEDKKFVLRGSFSGIFLFGPIIYLWVKKCR